MANIPIQRLLRNFIGNYYALSLNENNAIAGTSGNPSSTNKFVTETDPQVLNAVISSSTGGYLKVVNVAFNSDTGKLRITVAS